MRNSLERDRLVRSLADELTKEKPDLQAVSLQAQRLGLAFDDIESLMVEVLSDLQRARRKPKNPSKTEVLP